MGENDFIENNAVKVVKVKMVKMRSESGSSSHYNNKYNIYIIVRIFCKQKTILTKMTMTIVTTPQKNFHFLEKKLLKNS